MTDTTASPDASTDAAPASLSQLARRAAAEARDAERARILERAAGLAEHVLGAEAAVALVWAVNADAPADAGEHAAAADIADSAANLLYYRRPGIGQDRLELMLYCRCCRTSQQHPVRSLPELGRLLRTARCAPGAAAEQRLGDLRAEHQRQAEAWDRQCEQLTAERDEMIRQRDQITQVTIRAITGTGDDPHTAIAQAIRDFTWSDYGLRELRDLGDHDAAWIGDLASHIAGALPGEDNAGGRDGGGDR
jgi:hypothetical protein